MSTAGSAPERPGTKRPAIFRWRGIFALAFGFAVVVVVWLLFGAFWIRKTLESSASQSLGAEVDIAGLSLDLANTSVDLRGIAIADPRNLRRNLLEARVARLVLLPDALLEKKIVIRELTLDGVRTNTRRATPARAMPNGFAPRALAELGRWRKRFDVPLLSLTPIDTIRALVLDPTQLTTVQRALALRTRADSVRTTLTGALRAMPVRPTVDSAQALLARLKGQTPRTLGLAGTRNAVRDVRRLNGQVDSLRRRVDALVASARAAADSLAAGARALDEARRADYAFARGLLALPTIDAPNIGPALFGNVSIDAFEQALYLVALARQYAPPGLLPRESPGPKRVRLAGSTIHFVKEAVYPRFLLERANVTVALDSAMGAARGDYRLTASNVTTEPALVAGPMRFALDRSARGMGTAVESFGLTGIVDHTGRTPHELIELRAGGVSLPGFSLPATPLRADLGPAQSAIRLDLKGNAVTGSWTLAAPNVSWVADTTAARDQNTMVRLVTRVIQSVRTVNLTAELGGTLDAPRLSVRSNLDRAVADGIRGVVGTEVARAEARVRAQVDSLTERAVAPARALVAQVQGEVNQGASTAQTQLDDVKTRLAAQLKALGTGIIGLP